MRFIKELLNYFSYITTGTAFAFVIYTAIINVDTVPVKMIAQIPITGFIIALISTLMFYKEQQNKKKEIAILVLHIVFVSIAMICLGLLFEWIQFEIKQILLMLLCVVFVWIFTFLIQYFNSKKEADEINKAINNRYKQ